MYRASQLIAATDKPFTMKGDPRTIVVGFVNNLDINSILVQLPSNGTGPDNNLSLNFEHITSNDTVPVIDIYLNLDGPGAQTGQNYVGPMSLYGLAESSAKSDGHDGGGQLRIFDVSGVFRGISKQPNWLNKQFSVTLTPSQSLPDGASLTIGRITLYFNQS